MGMFNNAMLIAPQIVRQIDLSGCRNLLDMGGGPGTYAIHFCLQKPGLHATVFDLPTTRLFAERTIEKFQLRGRITFMAGDYTKERIRGRYDAIWMSHILHGEGPKTCVKMVRNAAELLEPGGIILIHEFILNNTKDGPLHPALFSLNMLLGSRGARSYSEGELMEMLRKAGMQEIRRTPIRTPMESGIIFSRK